MREYAIRYGGELIHDGSWRSVSDVMASFHGSPYCDEGHRVTGVLVSRRPGEEWEVGITEVAVGAWADEREDVLARFAGELSKATGDGSKKRQAGTKPPWYEDDSHEAAVFSHIMKWKKGELVDPDSGAHPLVHASWRLLAIACRETGNVPK